MSDRLTALDATFLELEDLDEGALMSIGGVMVSDPLPGGGAVGIAIFSYNGLVTFGINADCSRAPNLDVLAYGIEEGIEELCAVAPELATTHEESRY